jgi:hypothetical protein
MTAQLTIFPPPPESANVQWLEGILRERRDWLTAAELLGLVHKPPTDSNKRQLRILANASNCLITGQRGFKHVEHSTPEEIEHFTNWMRHQAREMAERAERVRKKAHEIFG